MSKKIIFNSETGEINSVSGKQGYTQQASNTLEIAGRVYKTVRIRNQIWMAENLDLEVKSSCYYENKAYYRKTYGRLYSWEEAMEAGCCVPGWHLPTDSEWTTLVNTLGNDAGTKLKEGGSSGFNALLAGYRNSSGNFDNFGDLGYFWSASPSGSSQAFYRYVYRSDAGVSRSVYGLTNRFSVRLLKD